jgi:Pyruvate/2-oxoacid:ferredoxin oxidoreductase delta subunit
MVHLEIIYKHTDKYSIAQHFLGAQDLYAWKNCYYFCPADNFGAKYMMGGGLNCG